MQDEIRALVAALNAYMIPLTPRQFQFQLTVDEMDNPDLTLFVARDAAGKAVGMGALREHQGFGEVKRMYTLPELRGTRIGAALLARIEERARQRGLSALKLETGEAPGFEAAWRLYERGGYEKCGAFLDYPDSGYSRFYEKKLV
nr:GNAT family N-acetyltransferase [Pseudohoeflea sp. DP4N28-3]